MPRRFSDSENSGHHNRLIAYYQVAQKGFCDDFILMKDLMMQVHILSKEIMQVALFLARYHLLPINMVEYLMVLLSKLVYGDLTKYGISRHEEGPFTVKAKYGKYPIIDLGTIKKIKSGEIQVKKCFDFEP